VLLVETVLKITAENYLAFLVAGGIATLIIYQSFGYILIKNGCSDIFRGIFYGFITILFSFLYEFFYGMKSLFQPQFLPIVLIIFWSSLTLFLGIISVKIRVKLDKINIKRANDEKNSGIKSVFHQLKTNPFLCKSEGMRRLTIVVSSLAIVFWIGFVALVSDFFKSGLSDVMAAVLFPVATYLIILVSRGLIVWIVGGFRPK